MELTAVSVCCGRLGLCVSSVSVNLDATFFSSKNAGEAASRLVLVVHKFDVLKDAYYVNSRPNAEVLARLLQTHLAQELQQLQQPAADLEVLVVIPDYPTSGSDAQATAIAVNMEKSDAMHRALQQLDIPGSCIVRKSTRGISGAVKSWLGQDVHALSGGNWKHRLQMERDAVEAFLQGSSRCSATPEVLQQFVYQDGRKNADARHDLSVVFWLAAAALQQKAEQVRLDRRGQQLLAKRQQQVADKHCRDAERHRKAADKQRKAAEKQRQALLKLLQQQQQQQAGHQVPSTCPWDSPVGGVGLAAPGEQPSAATVAAAVAASSAAEQKIDLTGMDVAAVRLRVKREAATEAIDLTQPSSPEAAGWAAAAAAAAVEPPGAPLKKKRRVRVEPNAECIVLDDN